MKASDCGFIMLVAGLLGFSCKEQETAEQVVRPVKLVEVASLGSVQKSFSGIVSANQFSDLAFPLSGTIRRMNVEVGEHVRKGTVVAEINPSTYQLDYEAKKVAYQKAEAQLQRAVNLLSKNAISKQEYESNQATYANAKAMYENASNNLTDTRLKAPFDGFIQKKYVENYQRIQSGQGVVCLINPDSLQIVFTLPEDNVAYITTDHSEIRVEFDAYKGRLFRTRIKEYVEASPDGAGIPVYLTMDDPTFDLEKYRVSVGFSCRVVVTIENDWTKRGMSVPLSAVFYDNRLHCKTVFVYIPATGRVEQRMIRDEGYLVGRGYLVVSGNLHVGEQVVAAGTSYLTDGQRVKVLVE